MIRVECKAGQFEGVREDSCYKFFGIPYAEYEQRWDASTLIEKELHFKAIKKGKSAPQTRADDYSQSGANFFQDNSLTEQSEDCLTLNLSLIHI